MKGLFLSEGQLQALTPCGILTQNPWDYHRLAMLTTRSCDCRLTRARPRVYICHKCEVQIKNHKTKQCLYWQHILTSPHTQMTGFTLLVNQPSRIRRYLYQVHFGSSSPTPAAKTVAQESIHKPNSNSRAKTLTRLS
ncbi:hypothetical protein ROHU_008593 [Labeo rohita]|uniref:Uncharacterized protein n=1 Tax=Labeo rohita TaxID=84645 RepID=A0A498M943_LABRO|nr:hypothetical protein ROHU_008593 [Labeo rohita]